MVEVSKRQAEKDESEKGEITTAEDVTFVADRKRTQFVMNTANMIDNADGQLYPSVYPQIQSSMHLSLDQLGLITSIQTILQSITTPIWGFWNDTHSRKKVLTFGLFLWGIFTIATAFSLHYIDMLVYRAIVGLGLACIIPTTSSVIADYFPAKSRGKAFGWLGLTQVLGVAFGTIFATLVVQITPTILGMESWRFVFVVWGVISIGIGFFVWGLSKDPVRGLMDPGSTGLGLELAENHKVSWADYKEIITNKTFLVIILQGLIGSMPWNAILFMVTWFEYIGFGPLIAGLIFVVIALGNAFGNLCGGLIGDRAAKWKPNSGRVLMAQISRLAGIPLVFVIFFIIPRTTASIGLYVLIGAITGFMTAWPSNSTNFPIFSEIFEPEIRGSVYSIDRVFEGTFQSLGSVFVSLVATAYGFLTPPPNTLLINLPSAFLATNASALAFGMLWVCMIPWIISLALYTFLYFTYPKDFQTMHNLLEARARVDEQGAGREETGTEASREF
jgi:MFS family permease